MRFAAPPRAVPPAPSRIQVAFEGAMGFAPPGWAAALDLPAQRLRDLAEEEASFGEIAIDERGLTAGTRLHIVQPGRDLFARWREARAEFDMAVEPKLADIRAVERLDAEIAERRQRRDEAVRQAEQIWEATRKHQALRARWEEAEAVFRRARLAHGDRAANMRAYSPLYWVGLLCIGVAEWLINYDTFLLFVGVPAIAAGATAILGVLLAFSAHGHGELLKQWSYRFGQHQGRMSRVSAWRLLGLATLGLGIVLGAAGASRYAAALRVMAAQPAGNILGSQAMVEVDPLRDVLISLLANLAAWAVGVFLSYLCHDPDPNLMAATRQHQRASRAYNRARRGVDADIRAIEGGFEKEAGEIRQAAIVRATGVAAEREMLEQMNKREEGILEAIVSTVRGNAERYRDALAQVALARRGEVAFVRRAGEGTVPVTAYDWRAAALLVDAGLLRAMT
jgi:hypothetical protein